LFSTEGITVLDDAQFRPEQSPEQPRTFQPQRAAPGHSNLGRQTRVWIVFAIFLCAVFAKSLLDLLRYSWGSELYSHILLIPFISAYLIWINRNCLPSEVEPNWRLAIIPSIAGLGLLAGYMWAVRGGWRPHIEDRLCIFTLAFLFLLLGGSLGFLGTTPLRLNRFPVAFLIFMLPFPHFLEQAIETFFQLGSAEAAYFFLSLSGMPIFREGTSFSMPGFQLVVAPECSGIHSSLVLFITSLIAGHLFFRARWRRWVLVLAVIPLALVRNGLRIFTIAQLCVHVSPDMIDSPILKHGGPLFFALSLIPFFCLVYYLRKQELAEDKCAGLGK
jgi:exosortase C (VPDSG-CTERM-specific)